MTPVIHFYDRSHDSLKSHLKKIKICSLFSNLFINDTCHLLKCLKSHNTVSTSLTFIEIKIYL
jgi:hypothetical protein